MNSPENVPIATLSGIASLTEIPGVLPLPTPTNQPYRLFSSQKESGDALESVLTGRHNPETQSEVVRHLSGANTAYLDFSNTIFNRPSQLRDNTQPCPLLRSALNHNPNIFQPQYETYHGSPIKGNSMHAYSPNQRAAYRMHQHQLQQKQQQINQPQQLNHLQQQQPCGSRQSFPYPYMQNDPASPFQQPQQSPLTLQGYASGGSTSSPMVNSGTSQQFFGNQQMGQSPHIMYGQNMTSPHLMSPPNLQNNAELQKQQILMQQQRQQQQLIINQQQQQQQNQQLQRHQNSFQSEPLPYGNQTPQNNLSHSNVNLHEQQMPSLQHPPNLQYQQSEKRSLQQQQQNNSLQHQNKEKQQCLQQKQLQQKQDQQQIRHKEHQHENPHSIRSEQSNGQLENTQEESRPPQSDKEKTTEVEQQNEIIEPHIYFSPLKTRRQIAETAKWNEPPKTKGESTRQENTCESAKDMTEITKSGKKQKKRKSSRSSNAKLTNGEEFPMEEQPPEPSIAPYENHSRSSASCAPQELKNGPQLELRVPKLIVRKVKHINDGKEVEMLEVYSPEKEVKLTRQTSARSTRSSVSSVESVKPKKRKKNVIEEEEDTASEDEQIQDEKRFRMDEDEGIEVKGEVRKFTYVLGKVLDLEMEMEADGVLDVNDDEGDIPPEALLARHNVTSLCSETAKMKACGFLKDVPVDQLVRVISSMDRHVRDTMQLSLTQTDEQEGKQWYTLQVERVLRSTEAALVILNIRTCPDMPKQVYLEEALEHTIMLCQHHLEHTIYPSYDPIFYKTPGEINDSGFTPKSKRSRNNTAGTAGKDKHTAMLYNKLCEVVSLLADTLSQETHTDSNILKMSTIAVSPFFVENVSVLQLSALRVARSIFRNYVKHRDLIMDDILASLARLPSSKRNLRNYRLEENVSIQMFTALVLQLVQCTVQIPTQDNNNALGEEKEVVDTNVMIFKSYDDALRAAKNFMTIFFKKCSSNSRDDNDYRPLFENFLHDLLTTANLPEWPAAQVLLTQLSRMFVVTFSNPKLDHMLRSSALEYLAQIVTHLRKCMLRSLQEEKREELKKVVERLINDPNSSEDEIPVIEDLSIYEEKLRTSLLMCLQAYAENEETFKYAREFYIGQWVSDVQIESEKNSIAPMMSIPGAKTSTQSEEGEENEVERTAEKMRQLEEKKEFLHSIIKKKVNVSTLKKTWYNLPYESCRVISDHLASLRSFSQSFDIYLNQLCRMLNEQAIGLRTKAVKALTMIVSVDPSILAREDVEASVHGRLLDSSTNVREATIDLIGQFVLKSPELIRQYYDMIIARILDTGVSVRKRVIKILKDICIEHPDFEHVPEICSRIIRRVDDEAGIKKLVTDVFRAMWFHPEASSLAPVLQTKAANITKVVSLCKDTGLEWIESLLESLLEDKQAAVRTATLTACQQLVNCLFQQLLTPESKSDSSLVVSCLVTLNLFCKVAPKLLIPHATSLQPYLSQKINSQSDLVVIQQISRILELVVPLMEHPSASFLASLEEDAMKLIMKQSQNVVQSCCACLAAVVNRVTHNYKFVIDAFNQFLKFLNSYRRGHKERPGNPSLKQKRTTLLRTLFTIGLFCRYFDLDAHMENDEAKGKPLQECKAVFELCMYFTDFNDEDVTIKALLSIGFIGMRNPEYLLTEACKKLYLEVLDPKCTAIKVKFTLLKSLQNHLVHEENRLTNNEIQAEVQSCFNNGLVIDREKESFKTNGIHDEKSNIKDMGDQMSGCTSELVQLYLPVVMKSFLHQEKVIRWSALQVVSMILGQGLVHPAKCIPYLVAISSDTDQLLCQVKAEQCLKELDTRFSGFTHMKSVEGVKMTYHLQTIVQKSTGYVKGYRETENKVAFVNHVFTLLRTNKQHRRSFLRSLLKSIDDQKTPLSYAYFLVENLAYISYTILEESLFIIHHINTAVSVSGASAVYNFKELLREKRRSARDETFNDVEDKRDLGSVIKSSFSSLLLLELKRYLKAIYGLTDGKCQKYSPSEPSKLYDKAVTRKTDLEFEASEKEFMFSAEEKSREEMLRYYASFKDAMMSLDTEEEQQSDNEDVKTEPKEEAPTLEGTKVVLEQLDQAPLDDKGLPGLPQQSKAEVATPADQKDMLEVPGSIRKSSKRSSRSSRSSYAE